MVEVSPSLHPEEGLKSQCIRLGWVLGDIGTDERWCRQVASQTEATVFDVGYRLAPEHKFPTAVEDSWKALKHVRLSHQNSKVEPFLISLSDP